MGFAPLTSSSSVLIGTGSKTFTTDQSATSTAFATGQIIRVFNTATPTNFMVGAITSFTSNTLVVNVTYRGGTGTFSSWTINTSGESYSDPIAIGTSAGTTSQGTGCVAIGTSAGTTSQALGSVAIGSSAGNSSQGTYAVAIGNYAGGVTQGQRSIAIGQDAGYSMQGQYAIAIGVSAGYSMQHANSIIINASGSSLPSNGTNRLFIAPIRSATVSGTMKALYYDTATFEITSAP